MANTRFETERDTWRSFLVRDTFSYLENHIESNEQRIFNPFFI